LFTALVLLPGWIYAAETADSLNVPAETKLTLSYLCGPQDSVTLTATLLVKTGDNTFALQNARIDFLVADQNNNIPSGTVATDQEGIAKITLLSKNLPSDKEGIVTYVAKFTETGKYPSAEATTAAKPALIKLVFSIEDSVKTLKVIATQYNSKKEEVPVTDVTVIIYIPRLFSLLKIGEIALDETGTGTLEFPKEIVGDTLGNLVVVAKIEEHDLFGFVQGKNTINWGIPKQYYKAEVPSRELWTPIAPMWMIITLIIMLLGVWAHYIYAVYELVMIKRLSKKENYKL
jgi:hypothetical protein